ncbi:hypothetical protein BBO99_00007004 [Phytophthora kernoviae]|uniref:EGF-like domain-containing protein n=2 Tax=Phytophthora kernoviae TaxID=325452 RepID=A0A421EW29_9STRA|nr:hypothetical protein G195_007638 [Phytophthora kernoviae 00238/432]KAG2521181.1 hypothetical protein JM18_006699 [Phytophthora kernoviae]KAG2529427.1 hypothetical protein JM16_000792 [Phytophthora kernoviae]RLN05945.1 hypothetical protein BBI17_005019 [Phytophthora kernoviae]RLN77118.1 hypothetical protein BBO99_00007004 [Phytophthora kernoviae]
MNGRRKMLLAAGLVLVSLVLLTVPTSAECPNGCSGNGACMAKDMCQCFKNYQGNDCLDRICQFGHAHVDTPKGDLNFDLSRMTSSPSPWILQDSQQFPAGTYEYFYPGAQTGEAHFYMECSNKGLCDRTQGTCACFDGFEGVACQRATCPNKCSGHGNCETIRKFGLKAPGTLFGNPSSAVPITYDLWDSQVSYGCRCDPWYHGPDCSLRSCKVGVDPMFLSVGSAVYETFVVHIYTAGTFTDDTVGAAPQNFFRLRLFDRHGESYITNVIPIMNDATVSANALANSAAVTTAITKIPNQAFGNVLCEPTSGNVGTYLNGYKQTRAASTYGLSVVCQFIGNPGKLRMPEVAAYGLNGAPATVVQVYSMQKGTDSEWFTQDSGAITGSPITNTGNLVYTVTAGSIPADGAVTLFKLGSHVVAGRLSPTTTLTLTYPILHTLSSTSIERFDVPSGTGFVVVEIVIVTPSTSGWTAGDLFFYENQFYKYMSIVSNAGNWDITLDRPFVGNSLNGGPSKFGKIYKVTPPGKTYQYNYVSECSGRGLCTTETGVCACFKGYTDDNCDTQNILAL